jgi:DNA-binding transcriptional MocR family regulator
MILRVDTTAAVPPYEQIRSQIATMIATGFLQVGRRLPTIRQLATDLGLAGGTIARAYRELEQSGLIKSRGRIPILSSLRSLSCLSGYGASIRAMGVRPIWCRRSGCDPPTLPHGATPLLKKGRRHGLMPTAPGF